MHAIGKATFYVATYEKGNPETFGKVQKLLAESFGGYTRYAHFGGWIDPRSKTVHETGHTYVVFISEENFSQIYSCALLMCEVFAQDCVLVEILANDPKFPSFSTTLHWRDGGSSAL